MSQNELAILIPYFNDTALNPLLGQLESCLAASGRRATLVVVDDGSHVPPDTSACGEALHRQLIIKLCVNQGHQRAIALGLAVLTDQHPHDIVVVMDGDGEDLPADVERLVAAAAEDAGRVVFAERMRRSEGVAFSIGYHAYRGLHRVLTGEAVRFGNFSAVPGECAKRLVGSPQLWNHYAAAVIRSKIPYIGVPTSRGDRLGGRSSMNWPALVAHGLSAFAVFADIIGARLLFASGIAGAVGTGLLIALAFMGIVPWTIAVPGVLAIGLAGLAATLAFLFVIQAGRQTTSFVPSRDYPAIILNVESR